MGNFDFCDNSDSVSAWARGVKHASTAIPRPIDEMGAPSVLRAGLMIPPNM
jgi:hypothetical protein